MRGSRVGVQVGQWSAHAPRRSAGRERARADGARRSAHRATEKEGDMANRALHALLFGGDDALRQRAWEAGVDTSAPLDVAVVVPCTEIAAERVVTVPLGGHVALLGAEVPHRLLDRDGTTAGITRAAAGGRPIPQA